MRTLLLLLFLPLFLPSQAQDIPFITEAIESGDGSRSLHLRGTFKAADSVFVQVYHDDDALYGEPAYGFWELTLSEYNWYAIKFTNTRKQVKYLWVMELSDDQHEFVDPIVVDFNRDCNLILRKTSNRRPDFMLEETGLGRER